MDIHLDLKKNLLVFLWICLCHGVLARSFKNGTTLSNTTDEYDEEDYSIENDTDILRTTGSIRFSTEHTETEIYINNFFESLINGTSIESDFIEPAYNYNFTEFYNFFNATATTGVSIDNLTAEEAVPNDTEHTYTENVRDDDPINITNLTTYEDAASDLINITKHDEYTYNSTEVYFENTTNYITEEVKNITSRLDETNIRNYYENHFMEIDAIAKFDQKFIDILSNFAVENAESTTINLIVDKTDFYESEISDEEYEDDTLIDFIMNFSRLLVISVISIIVIATMRVCYRNIRTNIYRLHQPETETNDAQVVHYRKIL